MSILSAGTDNLPSPDDGKDWKPALAKLLMGIGLFAVWGAIVLYMIYADPKNLNNAGNATTLMASIQSAFIGIGAVHLKNRTASGWAINAIKAVAAGLCLLALSYLVYANLAPFTLLVTDIGMALAALNIVTPESASNSKSGEAQ